MSGGRYVTNTVCCSDCGYEAHPDVGDHSGACLDFPPLNSPRSEAARIIRDYAERFEYVSVNMVRAALDAAAIPRAIRGGIFQTACTAKVLERAGHARSSGASAKGADVKTYRSLVYRSAA